MITKTNAVKMSITKWEKVVDTMSKAGIALPPWEYERGVEECGFCEFHDERDGWGGDDSCHLCPLNPDICYADGGVKSNALYWRIKNEGDAAKQLKLAQQMLEVIKTRGEKWIGGKK